MKIFLLTAVTMIAFAANSLLARGALVSGGIDPYTFTSLRIGAGAVVLGLLVALRSRNVVAAERPDIGSIALSAAALLGYALAFSLAYRTLDAGTGALILFGGVQLTMITGGLLGGERPTPRKWVGMAIAAAGVVYLFLPGATAPEPVGAALMGVSGVSWGIYSLRGRGSANPLVATARNFRFALPMALVAGLLGWGTYAIGPLGAVLALASGGLASGLGYALWYRTLRDLTATTAAIVQLSVPCIAALGGVLLLSEPITIRLVFAAAAVLGGIGLAVAGRR